MASCSVMYMQPNTFKMKEKKLDLSPVFYIVIMVTVFLIAL
jgi:hypothetical protein